VSNSLAIAAVTSTLRNLIVQGLADDGSVADTVFTTQPLDKARTGSTNQLNLFLYQTLPNAAWANHDLPPARNGEAGWPPLSLDLHYLLTAYGRDDDDVWGHHVLGRAMGLLHDNPVLDPTAIQASLADNDLDLQPERVRITALPLTLDELAKMWTAFQTQFRVSAGYRVSVVLIQSALPIRTPLPVLDRGAVAAGTLDPPYPALSKLVPPSGNPSARLGDVVTLTGSHLAGDAVTVNLGVPGLPAPQPLAPMPGAGDRTIRVTLPDGPPQGDWPVGVYSVSVTVTTASDVRQTNQLPLAIAPRVASITPDPAARDAAGAVSLTVQCFPNVAPRQRAELLVGDRSIIAADHPAATGSLTFGIPAAPVGRWPVRLRVDGIDSLLVDRTTVPPSFDASQQVTIT
jgi:hypothetical protein